MITTTKMDRKAANILLNLHDSNLKARGSKMNESNKANPMGIRIGLARIIIAKIENMLAIAKNSF
jgi:hypothetical protein